MALFCKHNYIATSKPVFKKWDYSGYKIFVQKLVCTKCGKTKTILKY